MAKLRKLRRDVVLGSTVISVGVSRGARGESIARPDPTCRPGRWCYLPVSGLLRRSLGDGRVSQQYRMAES